MRAGCRGVRTGSWVRRRRGRAAAVRAAVARSMSMSPQRSADRFAEAQAGVGEELDEQPPLRRDLVEQPGEFCFGERFGGFLVVGAVGGASGDADPRGGVGADQSVLDRRRKEGAQRRHPPPHGAAGQAESDQLADEPFHVAGLDLGQLQRAEERQRVSFEVAFVFLACLLAEAAAGTAGVACDPFREVLGEGDAGEGAVFAACDLGGERRLEQPCFGEGGERRGSAGDRSGRGRGRRTGCRGGRRRAWRFS